jgi:hypothetical protein
MSTESDLHFLEMRTKLQKAALVLFVKEGFSYILGLAILFAVFDYLDTTIQFNVLFILVTSVIFAGVRSIGFYYLRKDSIDALEVKEILGKYVG